MVRIFGYMKLTPRRLFVYIVALMAIVSMLTSCTKESVYDCGTVIGGNVEFNLTINDYIFYLKVDYPDMIVNERVDQKTYESFFVGDRICW